MCILDCHSYVSCGLRPSVIITIRRSFDKFFVCLSGRSFHLTRKRLVKDHKQKIPPRTPSPRMVSRNKYPELTCSWLCSFARLTAYMEEPQENAKRKFASLLDFLGKLFVAGLVTGRSACDCEVGVGSQFRFSTSATLANLGRLNLGLGPGVQSGHKSKLGPAGGKHVNHHTRFSELVMGQDHYITTIF